MPRRRHCLYRHAGLETGGNEGFPRDRDRNQAIERSTALDAGALIALT